MSWTLSTHGRGKCGDDNFKERTQKNIWALSTNNQRGHQMLILHLNNALLRILLHFKTHTPNAKKPIHKWVKVGGHCPHWTAIVVPPCPHNYYTYRLNKPVLQNSCYRSSKHELWWVRGVADIVTPSYHLTPTMPCWPNSLWSKWVTQGAPLQSMGITRKLLQPAANS